MIASAVGRSTNSDVRRNCLSRYLSGLLRARSENIHQSRESITSIQQAVPRAAYFSHLIPSLGDAATTIPKGTRRITYARPEFAKLRTRNSQSFRTSSNRPSFFMAVLTASVTMPVAKKPARSQALAITSCSDGHMRPRWSENEYPAFFRLSAHWAIDVINVGKTNMQSTVSKNQMMVDHLLTGKLSSLALKSMG